MTVKILLVGLMMTMMALTTNNSAQADGGFRNGCIVREWAPDATPSYRVNKPWECVDLDRQLDGNDGPARGRVRAGFRNSNNQKSKSGHWN
jgi:hypothetical protein